MSLGSIGYISKQNSIYQNGLDMSLTFYCAVMNTNTNTSKYPDLSKEIMRWDCPYHPTIKTDMIMDCQTQASFKCLHDDMNKIQ